MSDFIRHATASWTRFLLRMAVAPAIGGCLFGCDTGGTNFAISFTFLSLVSAWRRPGTFWVYAAPGVAAVPFAVIPGDQGAEPGGDPQARGRGPFGLASVPSVPGRHRPTVEQCI